MFSNVVLFFIGVIFPILAGLIFTPDILSNYGNEGFSVLAIFWAGLTFFTNFDFGVGRSVVKIVKSPLYRKKYGRDKIIAAGFLAQIFSSSLVAVIVFIIVQIIGSIFSLNHLRLFNTFLLFLPVLGATSVLRLIMEGDSKYIPSVMISTLNGVALFAFPYVMIGAGSVFDVIVITLFFRLCVLIVSMFILLYVTKHISFKLRGIPWGLYKGILDIGKWLTLGGVLSVLITYIDRFISSYNVPGSNLVYYLLPLEFIQKVSIVPVVLCRVLFPVLVDKNVSVNSDIQKIFKNALNLVMIYVLFLFFMAFFLSDIFELWLGKEFAVSAGIVPVVVLVGTAFSGLSYLVATSMIAEGMEKYHPALMMKYFPFYVVFLYLGSVEFGIVGVAFVYSSRITMESYFLMQIYVKNSKKNNSIGPLMKRSFLILIVMGVFTIGCKLWVLKG